jgi:hypothetical protein
MEARFLAFSNPNACHWGEDETDWMGDRLGGGRAYTCSSGASAGKFALRHPDERRRAADAACGNCPEP